jgi:structural maintenance of chromosome 4
LFCSPSYTDKTQVFHDQIELKQKELQPWTAKINAKRSEIDISSSERDALVKKLEAAKAATTEATATLESLRRDQEAKVRLLHHLRAFIHSF